MPSKSLYYQFVRKSMDPVRVLRCRSITNENKHDIAKLASILVSFGDFRDATSHYKIKRVQSEQIQAIAYLLQQAAAKLNHYNQRSCTDSVDNINTYERRPLVRIGTKGKHRGRRLVYAKDISTSIDEETCERLKTSFSPRPQVITCETKSTASPQYSRRFDSEAILPCDVNESIILGRDVPTRGQTCSTFASDSNCGSPFTGPGEDTRDAHFTLPEGWILDESLTSRNIEGILVRIFGTSSGPNSWGSGVHEGRNACILSVLRTEKCQTSTARVKLLRSISHDDLVHSRGRGEIDHELIVPIHFLSPVLPESCGDEVVVLHLPEEMERECAEVKGTRWRVRSFPVDDDGTPEPRVRIREDEVCDIVELESEMGLMYIPRNYLARYILP